MMKDRYILMLLILLGYILGLAGAPITDPVESNYALTAKEMLLSGDYISPRIYGNYWYDKPVLYYLELVVSYAVLGINDFATRLPSAVMAAVGIVLTYRFTRYLYGARRALIAAVILGTTLEYWAIGHGVITDMTLFVLNSSVLMAFFYAYREQKYNYYILAFVAAGFAVLTKGPIGLCLPGLIILLFLIWQRDLRALVRWQLAVGMVVFAGVAALWYVPMYLLHGSDFITNFLGVHNVLRATVSEHPKDNVWYYYPAMFILGVLPWSVPLLWGMAKRARALKGIRGALAALQALDVRTKFLLVWAVTVFLVFQSFATKYFSYTFPYMLPVAVLAADYFLTRPKLFKRLAIGTVAVYVILLYGVVQPQTERRSGYALATFVQPYLTPDTQLVFYSYDYLTSTVLYTDHIAAKLVTAEEREASKPGGISWNSKNVMPFLTYEEIDRSRPLVAIAREDSLSQLEQIAPGKWRALGEAGHYKKKCYVYYREAD